MEMPNDVVQEQQTASAPKLFVNNITFNDGKTISLDHNSIVVFTGANNCGKSQVLKDIERLVANPQLSAAIATSVESELIGTLPDDFIKSHLSYDNGNYWFGGNGSDLTGWQRNWTGKNMSVLYQLFLNRLGTEERLTVSKSKPLFNASNHGRIDSLNMLYKKNKIEDEVSKLFEDAFGTKLVVHRRDGQNVSLRVGERPDWVEEGRDGEGSYYNGVDVLPKLDDQGDGMRSFASILLDTFASDYCITLIDEPEAFLHPPQARLLGKMLAKNDVGERQLFISTHSEDFLQGLLDADNKNVKIIRINRIDDINHMSVLENAKIEELWSSPLLRYSNILSGLFHSKVVVCESDYDCLFYQAILDASYESKGEIAPDIHFTHCGGKQRLETVIKALIAVKVPVVAIADIDVLNDETILRKTTDSFGIVWDNISAHHKKIIEYAQSQRHQLSEADVKRDLTALVNEMQNTNTSSLSKATAEKVSAILKQSTAWTKIKETGNSFFKGNADAYNALSQIVSILHFSGLFVVPVGEIESFYAKVGGHGSHWWEKLVESKVNFATDNDLQEAREFVQSIAEYRPM
ncbi:hypothetical protein FACS1894167_05790 [Synergistales bacterium]|nr:hypothetical protein FACS1894167_05790 [Synergistales bacterium]